MDFLRKIIGQVKEYAPMSVFGSFISGNVNRGNLLENDKNWVAVAVDRIASDQSGVRFKVMRYQKNGDDEELFEGEVYDFLNSPNPQITGRDFIYLNAAFKELTGNAFWRWKKDGSKNYIEPLIPTRVTPILDKERKLTGYKYLNGTKQETIGLDEVIHDRYPSANNPYWGVGPLEKIAAWVDTDEYASEFNRLFFINGASFGGFIETEDESRERIELIKLGLAKNHSGVKNSHKIAVLPKNAKFKEATQTMRDMQFTELDDRFRDKILAAFGVPKTLAGLTTEVNRASAEASEYIFARHVIKPKVDRFVDFFNNKIIPKFDKTGQIYLAYENFIPEDKVAQNEEIKTALAGASYMTVNEVRASKGLPPISGGDVVMGNPFTAPIGEPMIDKSVKPIRGKKSFNTKLDEALDKIIPQVDKAIKSNVDDATKHKEFVARVDDYQKQMADKVRMFNQKQKAEVMQKLGRIAKAVSKSDLFDMGTEVGILIDFVTPLLRNVLTEQGMREYLEQGFEGEFNSNAPSVAKIIETSAKRLAKTYNSTTAQLLKIAINQGIQAGEGIPQIAERVADVYDFSDKYRAGQVAHTETFYAANEANREAYRQSGVVKTIRWYTADSDACQFCAPLNNKVIAVDEVFFKKGETYTGSQGGSLKLDYRTIDVPPIHTNCRCFIQADEISVTGKGLSIAPTAVDNSVDNDKAILDEIDKLLDDE